jgi:hypothetical protein
MATRTEQILQRVHAVLMGATAAGSSVHRGLAVALGDDELPGLNVRRGNTNIQALGNGRDAVQAQFVVDIETKGADWETSADALHEAVDALLLADAQLLQLAPGLHCTGTDPDSESADGMRGRISATYLCQFHQSRG